MLFSRTVYLFIKQTLLSHQTDTHFPRNPYFSPQTHSNFPGASIFSSNSSPGLKEISRFATAAHLVSHYGRDLLRFINILFYTYYT